MAHSFQLGELLNSQRTAATMTDVILVCEGIEFPAHKNILCAISPFFQAMFQEERGKGRIELPSVSVKEIELILSFVYTERIKDAEDPTLLKLLLKTSHMLQMSKLFEYCYEQLCKRMTCHDFQEVINLAELYNDERMTNLVLNYLAQHFTTIKNSDQFLLLNVRQLRKIIQQIDTENSSMDNTVKGLFRWAAVEKARENDLLDILTSLDLRDVSTEFLTEIIQTESLVKPNYHILTLLTAEATTRMLNSFKNLEIGSESKLLSFGSKRQRQVLSVYDVKKNQWSLPQILPFRLELGMSLVWFGGFVYVVGGGDTDKWIPLEQVIKYNYVTNTVESTGKLAMPVLQAGVGVLFKSIYVVNGLNAKSECLTTVQRYCPSTYHCKLVARTNYCHNRPHVLSHSNYLYVLGSNKEQNSVERYSSEWDQWTLVTKVPGEIHWCSAAIINDKLFVVPSQTSVVLTVYDFANKFWAEYDIEGIPRNVGCFPRNVVGFPRNIVDLPKGICGLYATKFQGSNLLLLRGPKGSLYPYDVDAQQLGRQLDSNEHPWNVLHTCVI